ncbi:MAG: ABC transporter permease [Vicinamibacteria bacterium]
MPIYDQSYRKHDARAPLRKARFWPITREALRLILQRRAFLVLIGVSLLPFIVRAVHIYVVIRFPEFGRVLPVDGRLFGEFLNQQIFVALLLSVFGGAGLIANDLMTGAILVYLSRPLTRRDYVLGKLGVLLALNLGVTLAPALALYGIGTGLAPGEYLRWERAWIGPAIVLHGLLIATVISLVALAVSSLSRSARISGLGFVGLFVGLEVARGILGAMTRRPEAHILSVWNDLILVGKHLFGITDRIASVPTLYPALVLAGVVLACLAILRSRVRAVEIVR